MKNSFYLLVGIFISLFCVSFQSLHSNDNSHKEWSHHTSGEWQDHGSCKECCDRWGSKSCLENCHCKQHGGYKSDMGEAERKEYPGGF